MGPFLGPKIGCADSETYYRSRFCCHPFWGQFWYPDLGPSKPIISRLAAVIFSGAVLCFLLPPGKRLLLFSCIKAPNSVSSVSWPCCASLWYVLPQINALLLPCVVKVWGLHVFFWRLHQVVGCTLVNIGGDGLSGAQASIVEWMTAIAVASGPSGQARMHAGS